MTRHASMRLIACACLAACLMAVGDAGAQTTDDPTTDEPAAQPAPRPAAQPQPRAAETTPADPEVAEAARDLMADPSEAEGEDTDDEDLVEMEPEEELGAAEPPTEHASGEHTEIGEHAGHVEGAAHGGHGGHHPGPINWADITNTEQPAIIVVALNLGILAFLLYRALGGPVANSLRERRKSIADQIEEATRIRKEAEARAKDYQAKLKDLEAELASTRKSLVAAGEAEKSRIIQEAKEQSERMARDTQFIIEQEIKQLRADLTRETVETAITCAEELLRSKITPDDQKRLAEEYLSDLGAVDAKPTAVADRPRQTTAISGAT